MHLITKLLVLMFLVGVLSESNNIEEIDIAKENLGEADTNTFIPTKEWQEVKEDQAIPPGLHVKMDLSTGGKWAKLMDESQNNAIVQVPSKEEKPDININSKAPPLYKVEELKAALKKFKVEKAEKVDPNKKKEIKSKFRSINEIREAFEQFNLHQESDVEVMKRLVSIINNNTIANDDKHLALQDLEYYVHQIDNANDLVTFGGFDVVVRTLNSSSVELREEAAHVIGSAMQSNPKVQIEALRSGVLKSLLLMLAAPTQPLTLRKKCMYAISSLIRHFPLAQTHFSQYGGFQIMVNLFQQTDAEVLQIKAINLINDLIEERLTTKKDTADPQREEKLRQYHRINLGKTVKDLDWCRVISSSLKYQQHNRREVVMKAMHTLMSYCQSDFQDTEVLHNLTKLQDEYRILAAEDARDGDTDSYFKTLHSLAASLLTSSKATSVKEEL